MGYVGVKEQAPFPDLHCDVLEERPALVDRVVVGQGLVTICSQTVRIPLDAATHVCSNTDVRHTTVDALYVVGPGW